MLTAGELRRAIADADDSTRVVVRLPCTEFDGGHGYVAPTALARAVILRSAPQEIELQI